MVLSAMKPAWKSRIRLTDAGFRSLGEDIDTAAPARCLDFHVFGSIAAFERERISERTKGGGLRSVRKRGRVLRSSVVLPAQLDRHRYVEARLMAWFVRNSSGLGRMNRSLSAP